MPKPGGPYFRKQKNAWYVKINGRTVSLGKDKEEAYRRWLAFKDSPTLAQVCLKFMEWVQIHRASSAAGYCLYLSQLHALHGSLPLTDLKPHHIESWVSEGKAVDARKMMAKRLCNWAVEQGYLSSSPLKGLKRVKPAPQHDYLTESDYQRLLDLISCSAFKNLIQFCWETGARPQEATRFTKRHVVLHPYCIVWKAGTAPKGHRRRVIYLTPAAQVIVESLRGPETAPVLLNSQGRPWTASAVKCRFTRLSEAFGRRLKLYTFRHSWITRLLLRGVDSHTVATLAGHRNTEMIDRVYSHLDRNGEHLSNVLKGALHADLHTE